MAFTIGERPLCARWALRDNPAGCFDYWITSSARCNSDCGTAMPSAFAVFCMNDRPVLCVKHAKQNRPFSEVTLTPMLRRLRWNPLLDYANQP